MSDTIRLPKEVAEAIETMKAKGNDGLRDFETLADDEDAQAIWDYIDGDNPNIERIGIYYMALVNGYEIEKTPEDELRVWYQDLQAKLDNANKASVHTHVLVRELTTIDKCLDLFNIKISGVNKS